MQIRRGRKESKLAFKSALNIRKRVATMKANAEPLNIRKRAAS